MIIVANKSGGLCNRLITFSHLLAAAKEYGYQVSHLAFGDYSSHFIGSSSDIFCRYPVKAPLLLKSFFLRQSIYFLMLILIRSHILSIFARLLTYVSNNVAVVSISPQTTIDLSDPQFIGLALKKRFTVILEGWRFRDSAAIQRHSEFVREYFTPNQSILAAIENLLSRARENCEILVGVHIRWGDYRIWKDGKYFFSIEQYQCVLANVVDLFQNKRVTFLISSNEQHDATDFTGFNFVLGTNSAVEDLYMLANCDYIVGPPSTYSMWASFYGQSPLYKIEDPSKGFNLSNFAVTIDLTEYPA